MLPLLLLVGWPGQRLDSDSDAPEPETSYWAYGPATSSDAPWDPWKAEALPSGTVTPYLADEQGTRWAVQALKDWNGRTYAWRPEPALAEGVYRLGLEELGAELPETHAVDLTGRDPAFRVSDLPGRVYVLREGEVLLPPGVGNLLFNYAQHSAYLRFRTPTREDPRGEGQDVAVPFDLYFDPREGDLCRVLRDWAWVSPTGELRWSKERIEGAADPDPVVIEDLSLHLGWDLPDDRIAGAEFGATIDLRALDARGAGICDLAASIGVLCFDCIGDGRDTCLEAQLHSGVMMPDTSETDWDAVPECPFSLDAATESCQPDTDSSGWCGASAAAFIVVPFLRRRRRAAS